MNLIIDLLDVVGRLLKPLCRLLEKRHSLLDRSPDVLPILTEGFGGFPPPMLTEYAPHPPVEPAVRLLQLLPMVRHPLAAARSTSGRPPGFTTSIPAS